MAHGQPDWTSVVTGNVTIIGTVSILGSVSIVGTVTVTGAVTVTGTVSISGTVTVTGAVTVTGSVSIIGTVTVTGAVTVTGSVTVSGTVAISGTVTVTGTVAISGSVTVTGTVAISGTVTISGAVTITGSVTILGNVYLPGDFNTVTGNQKYLYFLSMGLGYFQQLIGDYVVTTGKTLYITDIAFSSTASSAADGDKNCPVSIQLLNATYDPYNTVLLHLGGNIGNSINLLTPRKVTSGQTVRILVTNSSYHTCDVAASWGGYEV